MTERWLPRYPVYVPSKGRATAGYTMRFLERDRVPYKLVVEPSEADLYRERWPDADVLVLPADGMRLLGARLWIREHSIDAGFDRHWQIDDNCRGVMRLHKGRRISCDSGVALRVVEDFSDRYTNIGVSGLNYEMFAIPKRTPFPYWLNCHVYSCSLVNNRMEHKWRLEYNDDTDLCLQVLAGGMCTVAFSAFLIRKIETMQLGGGNTDDLYQGDGRLTMARTLQQRWPKVVETRRRFGRPQHHIRGQWRGFDQQLIRRDDLDWSAIEAGPNNYGLQLVQAADEVRSPGLRRLLQEEGGQ